ncbi:uncharacterized protein LOC117652584 [Thrips palmi]|uniref:Uncharacterized protein LOC117652584 n=1 Tax=Thrips palmi TaxID=161013 RepID=A0A6P9A8B5_THRPL|nr:uncharacterized protein LOC117652584 [Thrips palmi]
MSPMTLLYLICTLIMVVVPCSQCDNEFYDLATFNLHFRTSHQTCTKYECKVVNCNRKYSLWGSFSSHLVHYHNFPRHRSIETPLVTLSSATSHSISECYDSDSVEIRQENGPENGPDNDEVLDYKAMLKNQQDVLVAKLYANPAFPRNLVDKMVKDISLYLSGPFFDHFQSRVLSFLSEFPDKQAEIQEMFELVMNPFAHLATEYKRFAYFEKSGDFIKPVPYDISFQEKRTKKKSVVNLEMKPVQGQFIPLELVLKLFFELPFALSDTLAYMKSLEQESDLISYFTQCAVWQRKRAKFDQSDIVIPVNFYYDEYEPNSALGAHLDPLGCSYVHIPCLPTDWSSKLENIFLALLFDGHNRSIYGNLRVFRPVLSEFKKLQTEGVIVNSPDLGDVKVYFVLGVILGDNKGLHEICGFMESFNANFLCRMCKCSKQQLHSMVKEDPSLLRTPEDYAADVELNDSEVTGIKEKCVFTRIPSFEAPTDICVDEFHDVIEGVAHYTMLPVLRHFHAINKNFLPTLNNRMYCIDLGIDSDNRPPLINADRQSKDKLKMTGAEMYTFIRIFGVLVKDMVPEGDRYYKLYLLLHDILSLVKAKALSKYASDLIEVAVKEHHELYMILTKEDLKPKHHFLIHYFRLFLLFGCFGPLSTTRFEGKHKLLKSTSNVCSSRQNLPVTVAIKQQLGLCFRSVAKSTPRHSNSMVVGPVNFVDYPAFSLTLPDFVFDNPHQNVTKWVDFKGTRYEQRQVLVIRIEDGLFQFAEIKTIVVLEESPLFLCSPFETIGYFSDVRGYELEHNTTGALKWISVHHSKLLDPSPLCLFTMSTGEKVVVMKYFM